jgi:hypothetical protein
MDFKKTTVISKNFPQRNKKIGQIYNSKMKIPKRKKVSKNKDKIIQEKTLVK